MDASVKEKKAQDAVKSRFFTHTEDGEVFGEIFAGC